MSEKARNMLLSLHINTLRLSKWTTQPNLQAVDVFWFNLVIKSMKAVDWFISLLHSNNSAYRKVQSTTNARSEIVSKASARHPYAISSSSSMPTKTMLLHVLFQKGVRGFHQVYKLDKTLETTGWQAEARVFEITSTKKISSLNWNFVSGTRNVNQSPACWLLI